MITWTDMNDSISSQWRTLRTSLTYQLAIFALWRWRFEVVAYQKHFTEIEIDTALSVLPEDSTKYYLFPSYPISRAPASLQTEGDRLIYTPKTFPNYFVDLALDAGFEKYVQDFSSKTRSTLKRKVRRFAEASPDGKLDWRVYRSPKEMAQFLDLASELSELTYQARLLDSGLPSSAKFRAETMELATKDRAYGFILFLAERPAAYVLSKRSGGIVTYDYVGHNPALNALSPGTVLQYQLLEYLFSDSAASVFDFTEGEGTHKALFATDHRLCARSFVFPRRMGTSTLVRCHLMLNKLNRFIDVSAERLGLRQRLRALMRSG
jgi:CelD/BcsL family acetyltransferase involved in cellulose biosynthesis